MFLKAKEQAKQARWQSIFGSMPSLGQLHSLEPPGARQIHVPKHHPGPFLSPMTSHEAALVLNLRFAKRFKIYFSTLHLTFGWLASSPAFLRTRWIVFDVIFEKCCIDLFFHIPFLDLALALLEKRFVMHTSTKFFSATPTAVFCTLSKLNSCFYERITLLNERVLFQSWNKVL